jgi:hypothetical protein
MACKKKRATSKASRSTESPAAAGTSAPATEANVAPTTETPLEYMLRVMRDPSADDARRDAMAKAALPYLHARPTSVVEQASDDEGRDPRMVTFTWQPVQD